MQPELLPYILAGIGGAALVAALFARRSAKPAPLPEPATEPDLLAANDDAEWAQSVAMRPKPVEETASPAESEEPDSLEWEEESEGVYRPAEVDAARFVAGLGLAKPPMLEAKKSCIFLRKPTHEKIQTHLKSNTEVELGGLLLGQAFHDAARELYVLCIEEALPVQEGVETPTTFSYTSASWAAILPQLQQMNPDWTVLGTYHSHPDMGVFLSSTDMDTQEGIFSQPWQIALVVDPVANEIGFFLGEEGTPCPLWFLLGA